MKFNRPHLAPNSPTTRDHPPHCCVPAIRLARDPDTFHDRVSVRALLSLALGTMRSTWGVFSRRVAAVAAHAVTTAVPALQLSHWVSPLAAATALCVPCGARHAATIGGSTAVVHMGVADAMRTPAASSRHAHAAAAYDKPQSATTRCEGAHPHPLPKSSVSPQEHCCWCPTTYRGVHEGVRVQPKHR